MKIFQTKNGARKIINKDVVLLLHALVSKRAKQFLLDREELFGHGEFYVNCFILVYYYIHRLSRSIAIA